MKYFSDMVKVFITDLQTEIQVHEISSTIKNKATDLKISFDLNETGLPFPCGHTILRIEGSQIFPDKIIATVRRLGFNCDILEDKVCR